MNIAMNDWTPTPERAAEAQGAARTGMGALLTQRPLAETPQGRWKSLAVSLGAHAAIAYVVVFVSFTAMKAVEENTITVSIATPEVSQPTPPPEVTRLPDIVMPTVPQIAPPQLDIAAPPSQMAIQSAPPVPPAPPQPDKTNPTESAVTPPRFDADYLNNPAPAYPNMSRRLREIGVVQLRVRVSTAGQPMEVQMAKSSGYARLDEAAQTAVRKWKFQPALRNNNAVEAWVLVPIEFSLTRG